MRACVRACRVGRGADGTGRDAPCRASCGAPLTDVGLALALQREREGTPGAGDAAAKPTHRRDVSTCNTNLNVNWMDYSGAWSFYLLAVIMVWFCFFVLDGFRSGTAWTYTNMVHFLITFYLFHWKKGSPINADQGQFDDLTFWEQIDDGVHWTNTKKFLAGVPIGLCLLASNPYTGVAAEVRASRLLDRTLLRR